MTASDGAWVVWNHSWEEYQGYDRIFATESDAREWRENDRDRDYLTVTFVPWGRCAKDVWRRTS